LQEKVLLPLKKGTTLSRGKKNKAIWIVVPCPGELTHQKKKSLVLWRGERGDGSGQKNLFAIERRRKKSRRGEPRKESAHN